MLHLQPPITRSPRSIRIWLPHAALTTFVSRRSRCNRLKLLKQHLSRIDAAASVSNCSRIDDHERPAAIVTRCSRSVHPSRKAIAPEPMDPVSTRRCSCNLHLELIPHKPSPAAPVPSALSCSRSVQHQAAPAAFASSCYRSLRLTQLRILWHLLILQPPARVHP